MQKNGIKSLLKQAMLVFEQGKLETSKELCFNILKITKYDPDTLSLLMTIFYIQGDYFSAKEICLKLIKAQGELPLLCLNFARILLKTGEIKESKKWLLKIRNLGDKKVEQLLLEIKNIELQVLVENIFKKYHKPQFSFASFKNKLNKKNKLLKLEQSIFIIVPVYNGIHFLDELFSSILKNTFVKYKLIIINDKSSDEKVLPLLESWVKKIPEAILINNQQNLGFTRSVNKGMKLVKNHCVILNQDTVVPPGWLERLIYPIQKNKKVASVTPFSNAATICSFPKMPEDNDLIEGFSVDEIDSFFQKYALSENYFEIPTGIGFCMAINFRTLNKIGGLNEELFPRGYGEENDWCMRAKQAGFINVHATNLFVYHKHGGSFDSKEKRELVDRAMEIIGSLYPEYHALVGNFIKHDPVVFFRQLVHYKILEEKFQLKNFLVIDHALGGGANKYAKENLEIQANDNRAIFYLRYNTHVQVIVLYFYYQDIEYLWPLDTSELGFIIDFFNIDTVYLNEIVSYPKPLSVLNAILEAKNIHKFTLHMLVHDYYSICPSYTLINNNGVYCNVPSDFDSCSDCFDTNVKSSGYIQSPNKLDMSIWREKWGEVLEQSEKVVCFSQSSYDILRAGHPKLSDEKKIIIPHKTPKFIKKPYLRKKSPDEVINIGVLGSINYSKGFAVIQEMSRYLEEKSLNVKLIVMGQTSTRINNSDYYLYHGVYQRDELPELMEKYEIDIIFLPSICPETYSYVTDEAILMDVPIAVFDLGAPPERVVNYSKGYILKQKNTEEIINDITKFVKSLRIGSLNI